MRPLTIRLLALAAVCAPLTSQSFVNWETPHVTPLALTPSGDRLLAVDTADNRLLVFDVDCPTPEELVAIPVGLDPVSVRARTDDEAWVVNHVSDSVSVVDLTSGHVVATLDTDDEPADVVFAGSPQRAFVSCSQANTVLVFDPADLSVAPIRVAIGAEEPRAMAVSADGGEVYVAIFESGNRSTSLGGGSTMAGGFPPNVVNEASGPHGGVNPPPNDGGSFTPPIDGGLPTPPAVGMIVKQDAGGAWMDDNGGDWTDLVSGADAALSGRPLGWTLLDRDVAILDANTLMLSYAEHLMNVNMALAVRPTDGAVTVVGTDATNEVRFEPNLTGVFLRVRIAAVDPSSPAGSPLADLNPHVDYSSGTLLQSERDQSIGDPRGIVWSSDGARAYVTGMGSNNVVVTDASGARVGLSPTIEVGEGPTGIVLDEAREALYVLNKFEGSLSVVSTASELEVARVPFFDPTPSAVRDGRRHLYGTHETSGTGIVSCASCHVDARMDRLAWDLGDPGGAMKPVAGQNLAAGLPGLTGGFEDFHPMKGPMTTQTLRDIIGKEPHHWRGDRDGIEEFSGAFIGLLGDDATLSGTEMQEFEDMLASIHFPPNPFRELDNGLPTDLPLEGHYTTGRFGPAGQPLPNGNAVNGLALYRPPNVLDMGALDCVTCHTLPVGIGTNYTFTGPFTPLTPLDPGVNGELHHALVSQDGSTNVSMKIPHLRNLYEKVGFELTQTENVAGFGFLHDGSIDSLARFVSEPVFTPSNDQQVADLVAFMLSFSGSDLPTGSPSNFLEPPGPASQDTHAAVGRQTTLVDAGTAPFDQLILIGAMAGQAAAGDVGLVVKGRQAGEARGYVFLGAGLFQSDRSAETLTQADLQNAAALGSELTFTVVPKGSETRIGIDRDEDGFFDRDELDAGSDPADATSVPSGCQEPLPAVPGSLMASFVGRRKVSLSWSDLAANESGYLVQRASPGPGAAFVTIATLGADAESFKDSGLRCGRTYVYRIQATNCSGVTSSVCLEVSTTACGYVETQARQGS